MRHDFLLVTILPFAVLVYLAKLPVIFALYATAASLVLALFLFKMKATLE